MTIQAKYENFGNFLGIHPNHNFSENVQKLMHRLISFIALPLIPLTWSPMIMLKRSIRQWWSLSYLHGSFYIWWSSRLVLYFLPIDRRNFRKFLWILKFQWFRVHLRSIPKWTVTYEFGIFVSEKQKCQEIAQKSQSIGLK